MKRLVLIMVFLAGLIPGARAQDIVTDISQYEIELRHSFTGQELLLFGAIREGGKYAGEEYDIVIVITGEERPHMVRKKERVMGFWVNTEGKMMQAVPEYYGLVSTRPLLAIASEEELTRLKIGLDHQDFVKEGGEEEYSAGLIRVKERIGLYQVSTRDMKIQDQILFRAGFFFPSNVPSGSYTATAYLFRDGRLIGRSDKEIRIDKAGFERMVYDLAHDQPALYGIMAIVIALFAGWLAGFITRPKSKLR